MRTITSLSTAKQVVASLDFSQDQVETLKSKLLALTEATVTVRVGRDAEGKIAYGEVPDTAIQLAATVKALEFAVGKPKQMLEVSRPASNSASDVNSPQRLMRAMAKNPELVHEIIEQMKGALPITEVSSSQVIESVSPSRPPE